MPPLKVRASSSSVTSRAFWVPLTVMVPPVPFVPAEKKRSSKIVVVRTEGVETPVLSTDQKVSMPQVPVAAPEPVVVLLVSQ